MTRKIEGLFNDGLAPTPTADAAKAADKKYGSIKRRPSFANGLATIVWAGIRKTGDGLIQVLKPGEVVKREKGRNKNPKLN